MIIYSSLGPTLLVLEMITFSHVIEICPSSLQFNGLVRDTHVYSTWALASTRFQLLQIFLRGHVDEVFLVLLLLNLQKVRFFCLACGWQAVWVSYNGTRRTWSGIHVSGGVAWIFFLLIFFVVCAVDHCHAVVHLLVVLFAKLSARWSLHTVLLATILVEVHVDARHGRIGPMWMLPSWIHFLLLLFARHLFSPSFFHIVLKRLYPSFLQNWHCFVFCEDVFFRQIFRSEFSLQSSAPALLKFESFRCASRYVSLHKLDILSTGVLPDVLNQLWVDWVVGVTWLPCSSLV